MSVRYLRTDLFLIMLIFYRHIFEEYCFGYKLFYLRDFATSDLLFPFDNKAVLAYPSVLHAAKAVPGWCARVINYNNLRFMVGSTVRIRCFPLCFHLISYAHDKRKALTPEIAYAKRTNK